MDAHARLNNSVYDPSCRHLNVYLLTTPQEYPDRKAWLELGAGARKKRELRGRKGGREGGGWKRRAWR